MRTAAGLFDVSGLKNIHLTGPDALAVANHLITRDMTKIYPGKSIYTLLLNDDGCITDDCIMFNCGPNDLLMVHSSSTGCDHVPTTLFDRHCMISRTGYSSEHGYEIFCKGEDAGRIWDSILEDGKAEGIIPCSFDCIDMIRVEAALLFYPYDIIGENTPRDMGLGFTVSKNKRTHYRGKEGLMAAAGNETVKTYGIVTNCETAFYVDAEIFLGPKKVGKVTQPMYSILTEQSLAMVQLISELAGPSANVEVRWAAGSCSAVTHPLPFYDPEN